jgi:hypothetical protein
LGDQSEEEKNKRKQVKVGKMVPKSVEVVTRRIEHKNPEPTLKKVIIFQQQNL